MWHPQHSCKAYPTREAFVRDCVPILRREIELLRDEGVSIIQVDDPNVIAIVGKVGPPEQAPYDEFGHGIWVPKTLPRRKR